MPTEARGRASMDFSETNNNRFPSFLGMTLLFVSLTFMLFSCKPEQNDYKPQPYEFSIPLFFPNQTNIPNDNPMTIEGVELGRKLFYDPRLSGRDIPGEISNCASCHHQEKSFKSGVPLTGTSHSMLPMVNLAWNTTGLGWNGSVATLEDMVLAAVTAENEINGDTVQIVNYLQATDDYPILFQKAFGSNRITFKNVQRAIAQFVRSLVSSNSKFDQYLRGEAQLTQDELNGYVLFVTEEGADCFHCHGSGSGNALMTTNLFYNNGLDNIFNDPNDRYSITHNVLDKGAYKAPTLRNIAVSSPYMHDGRYQTLDQVIDFYSDSVKYSEQVSPLMHHVMQGGVHLTEQEKQQLKAFLNTLTDSTFLNNPNYAKPN